MAIVYSPKVALFGASTIEKNSDKIDKLAKSPKSPVTFWTTACQKFRDHETKSPIHKFACVSAESFLKIMHGHSTAVDQQISAITAAQIAENRKKLHPIVKTIILCGRRNFGLRGHRDGEDSKNPGNFKALLDFQVDSGDVI